MEQSIDERKIFLKNLNEISRYTGAILHGDEVSKGRIKQIKKYFNRTYNMLHRISVLKGEIHNGSFRYGYGGKILVRKVMLDLNVVEKNEIVTGERMTYNLLLGKEELTLELVSRIIVEVYLIRNDIDPI